MEITADWVSAAIAGAVAGGTAMAFAMTIRQRAKDAKPLIRPHYVGGYLDSIEIVNRLNEDLRVTRIEAQGDIYIGEDQFDAGGSLVPGSSIFHSNAAEPDWTIHALTAQRFTVSVMGDSQSLSLTIVSSLRTIRSMRTKVALRNQD